MGRRKNRKRRVRIHREGRTILLVLLFIIFAVNLPVYVYQPHWVFALTLFITLLLFIFVSYFFRNPYRIANISDENLLVAPADGTVVVVEEVEENEVLKEKRIQVSIFMSIFCVHANWYPTDGKVLLSEHQSGNHNVAWLPKSSTENERSTILMETRSGKKLLLRQIAGAMARRIVTYAKAGHDAHRDEHLGFIKFGSRVDIFLPIDSEVFVAIGEKVRANETIIARLADANKDDGKA